MPGPARTKQNAGFSLLELIVVTMVLGLIAMAVVPTFGASMSNMRSEDLRHDLLALVKYVQQQAVVESREHRIYFDDDAGAYWVMYFDGMDDDDKLFVQVDEAYAQKQELPVGWEFQRVPRQRDAKVKAKYLAFYPSGACDRTTITIGHEKDRSRSFSIETLGVLGKVELTD